jgi:hypothetical protein
LFNPGAAKNLLIRRLCKPDGRGMARIVSAREQLPGQRRRRRHVD